MIYHRFEELPVWQYAKKLTIEIYRTFKQHRDWAYRDQIQRASVSIMNNIAEGFERGSTKELRQFLYIAKGSCGEVRSMLAIAVDVSDVPIQQSQKLSELSQDISKMLAGFIRSLRISTI